MFAILVAATVGRGQVEPAVPPALTQDPVPTGQEPDATLDPSVRRLQGRIVRAIHFASRDSTGRMVPMAEDAADKSLRVLTSRAGQPLEVAKVSVDIQNLWSERRLVVRALASEQGEEVDLTFLVLRADEIYERVEFKGLSHLDRREVDELVGLYPDRQVTTSEAIAMRNVLVARYKRDGFAFCDIQLDESTETPVAGGDRTRKLMTFRVDEGPKVTVGGVRFRGHRSFPVRPFLGFIGSGDFLIRDAHIQSGPAGSFLGIPIRGEPYSREVIEEDLDRLRLFYRSRGYLDALVDLADATLNADRTEVDLEFLVVEGPRYRVRSVGLVREDGTGNPIADSAALYPTEQVLRELEVKAGDYYDHTAIRRDIGSLRAFYGARGHPSEGFQAQNIPDLFIVRWPRERYTEDAEVELTFRVSEGTPKTLRDIIIRGNTYTRDKVIRRRIFQMPGERLDMTKVDKSVRHLEATRYFFNPITLQGPTYELVPVRDAPDHVDLAFDLEEGETGEFRWGLGITSGAGAQATLQFNKRNFDLWNLPSTWDPIGALGEIIDNKAFHGGGQQLDLLLSPGTEISQFQIGYSHPDLFGDHFDTYELRTTGRRRIRRFRDGYTADVLGGDITIGRNLTENFSVSLGGRIETVKVKDLAADAPVVAFDAEGQTELRGMRTTLRYRDHDDLRRPSSGFDIAGTFEVLGGPFGGEESLTMARIGGNVYVPLGENASGHKHILRFEPVFGLAEEFGGSNDVFLTERFYMGGFNLRGFDFRGAGPSQFGRALGGEAILTASLEYSLPLLSTRMEGQVRDTEFLRGVLFSDFGLLGLGLNDPTFREPRLSFGIGLRIEIPMLQIPIALDLAWPVLFEESDDRRQFFFSIQR